MSVEGDLSSIEQDYNPWSHGNSSVGSMNSGESVEESLSRLEREVAEMEKYLQHSSDNEGHQSRARRVLFIQKQKQLGRKLNDSNRNNPSEH